MPEPYHSAKILPFDGHSWFGNGAHIAKILENRKIRTAIEVGSWLGASTRFIAERLPPEAKLYAVDTWKGSLNEEDQQKDPRLPHLYQLFLSNVIQTKLTEVIVPIRMESLEASKAMHIRADLIYIDASHDTESVYNDIMAWHQHLAEGGVICGDDWGCLTVRAGVEKAASILGREIQAEGNFWRYM